MNQPFTSVLAVVWGLVGLTASAAEPTKGEWKLVQKAGETEVYTREVKGQSIRSLKGTGVVDASVVRVAQVLLDCQRATHWVDSLTESRVVSVLGPNEYIEYNRVAMPLFVEDREFITHVRMSVDEPNKRVTIRSEPSDHPSIAKRAKYTRGTLAGLYVLEAGGDGRTHVTVEVVSDPKGWIPGWLVDFFQKDWPRLTIEGIRSEAAQTREPPAQFKAFLETVPF